VYLKFLLIGKLSAQTRLFEENQTSLFFNAKETASVRVLTFNLERILLTCDLAVDWLTNNRSAICWLFMS